MNIVPDIPSVILRDYHRDEWGAYARLQKRHGKSFWKLRRIGDRNFDREYRIEEFDTMQDFITFVHNTMDKLTPMEVPKGWFDIFLRWVSKDDKA